MIDVLLVGLLLGEGGYSRRHRAAAWVRSWYFFRINCGLAFRSWPTADDRLSQLANCGR